jgi:DNA mismatch repair protein MutS2
MLGHMSRESGGPSFTIGDSVQTPLGKGVVRDVRTKGRLLVEVGSRAVVVEAGEAAPLAVPKSSAKKQRGTAVPGAGDAPHREQAAGEIDLHGFTVEEALARAESALNEALLADHTELRLIHGRSGGRIRSALHRRLREISSVRAFRIDPRNEGVTIVTF